MLNIFTLGEIDLGHLLQLCDRQRSQGTPSNASLLGEDQDGVFCLCANHRNPGAQQHSKGEVTVSPFLSTPLIPNAHNLEFEVLT